ncbi:MAG TPA: hypothetical protein VGL38_01160 [bacterium]
MISPEAPAEFAGLPSAAVALIRRSREEKVEMRRLERERALAAGVAAQAVLDCIDQRIAELDASRNVLLGKIAGLMPGYNQALDWACTNARFNPSIGSVRYYKRNGGYFTFGMPGREIFAVNRKNK